MFTALQKQSNTFAGAKIMRKMFFFVLAAAALLLMVPTQNAQAQSQSETPKVEIGAHYTLLRFRDFDITDSGVGGRVTFNLTDNFGVEGELNVFPQKRTNDSPLTTFPLFVDSSRTQGLFGVKTGLRSEKAGIFGKFRPGFVRFGESGVIPGQSFTQFALDIGGVFELYPTRHVALRFDIGDTVVRFGSNFTGGDAFYSNNLQISTGVAFRF
jgi:Outer membrane protein beta-barrel domain